MNITIDPRKLSGTIDAIPSKSHAHRLLIACKLAELQGRGRGGSADIPSFSDDIDATKNCLVQLDKDMPFLDCRESGSTLRFMLPVAMALKEEAVFLGSGKLPDRPISPLKEEMEAHGCSFYIDSAEKKSKTKYREICTVRGRLRAGEYSLAGNISSQFITGLLFALPLLEGDSVLRLTTELESSGYVDMTLDVLRSFGIEIGCRFSGDGLQIYEIPGRQRYTEPESLTIEGDWSNASFWLVCGALGGPVTVKGLNPASTQADKEIVNILSGMGADVLISDGITVSCSGRLKAAEVSVAQTPDMVPVLAVAMAAAEGASMITNAERLKLKESDRLKTVYDFLSRLGADITYGGSGLSLTGVDILNGGDTDSHNDHRIAMAAATASCVCKAPVIIRGAEAVNKSYPGFFSDFAALGGIVRKI